jgi:FlaA1/EpsC-like NDP-sugar epimerase
MDSLHGNDAVVALPARRSFSIDSVKMFALLNDAVGIALPATLIYMLYVSPTTPAALLYLGSSLAICLATVVSLYFANLYTMDALARPWRSLVRLLPIMFGVLLAYTGFLFALKASDQLSRVWVFLTFVTSAGLVAGGRFALSRVLDRAARAGHVGHRMVVYGAGERGQHLVEFLHGRDDPMMQLAGVLDDRGSRVAKNLSGMPLMGGLDDLKAFVRERQCDEILVALPGAARERA